MPPRQQGIVYKLPSYILVGHAAHVVHAAKNSIRMAALSGRIDYREMPWGMVVSVRDLCNHYTPRDYISRSESGKIYYDPLKELES